MPEPTPDTSWSDLAELDEEACQQRMVERCREVAALGEEVRLERLQAMVSAEYTLGDTQLRDFTRNRLRAWLTIEAEDMAAANTLARGYDTVFDRLPGALAMRRASMVQTVARSDLSSAEVERLFELIPSLVRHVPRAKESAVASAASVAAPLGGRPWWKFWARA